MTTPDLVQELGFRVLDEEDDDPVLLRADGTPVDTWREGYPYGERLPREIYDRDKRLLQIELLKLQYWVKRSKQRLVIVFEGRDAAGKGGTIKRFMEHLNPRGASIVALEKPTEREQTQWYFQRYVAHLPAAGEMTLFDRSWYNRACVERVMGYCDQEQYEEFMRQAPEFERMLVRSGILLVKLWFSVSQAEQQTRFTIRQIDHTDTPYAPWTVVKSNDKKRARLEAMRHVLSLYDYTDKDQDLVGHPDPKILGPAAQVLEHGESATRTFPVL
ncbi:polyphosphate kinase 2 family protein [Kribbella shirazensis]|uniref:Polyphosphate kinase 2 n=1 Tax=Kribbella shirazensis TaxID=1105143 RepID=A0A7X5VEL4_9ACTN|nr:polyphosphate kinase 2 family protein [Kribbella shirazensis]NIK59713.1 polyphosphate kinase 2 [Kribbella shirazensis]